MINEDSLSISGTVDDNDLDKYQYDYVILATDVGSNQKIFQNSLEFYKNNDKIYNFLEAPYANSISKMKIAPPYKVIILFSICISLVFKVSSPNRY